MGGIQGTDGSCNGDHMLLMTRNDCLGLVFSAGLSSEKHLLELSPERDGALSAIQDVLFFSTKMENSRPM